MSRDCGLEPFSMKLEFKMMRIRCFSMQCLVWSTWSTNHCLCSLISKYSHLPFRNQCVCYRLGGWLNAKIKLSWSQWHRGQNAKEVLRTVKSMRHVLAHTNWKCERKVSPAMSWLLQSIHMSKLCVDLTTWLWTQMHPLAVQEGSSSEIQSRLTGNNAH